MINSQWDSSGHKWPESVYVRLLDDCKSAPKNEEIIVASSSKLLFNEEIEKKTKRRIVEK